MMRQFAAILVAAQIAPPPPPPPMISVMPDAGPQAMPGIVDYTLQEVRCRGEATTPVDAASPLPSSAFLRAGQAPPRYQLAFRIDASGRPLTISSPNRAGEEGGYHIANDDLAPALAATRFAPGAPRDGCVATYSAASTSVADAPVETLYRFIALPKIGSTAWQAVAKRLRDGAPGCFTPKPPQPLLQGFPDFDAIPQRQGTFSYAMIGFDIDATGVPKRVRTLASDGNAAFDRAASDAIARSRFTAGARTGCHYPFFRRQSDPTLPPPPPEAQTFVKPGATCDAKAPWTRTPVMNFPEPFRRRPFEGWAVVRYDVAPWGATGNIEVLASEPAAAFGEQAKRVIASATKAPLSSGMAGCVDRVLFRLPEGTGTKADEPAPITAPPPF